MAEAIAVVVLLMIPVVPVGLVLVILGWRGRVVRTGGVCPACGGVIPGGSAAGPAAGYCQRCGASLAGVVAVGQVQRQRRPGLLISGLVVTAILPMLTVVLFGTAVMIGVMADAQAGGAGPRAQAAPLASPPGPAGGGQGVQVEAARATAGGSAEERVEVGTTAAEVMVAFTKAMMDGDERTMLGCFVVSEEAHRPAIVAGVGLKAAMVRLASETTLRFGTEQQKQEWQQRRDEMVSRWANGQFVAEGDTGTLTPGAGKKNDLMPRHFVKTAEGWRLDLASALRQNILGMTGGVALDQDKTRRLNEIVEQVRAGKYASREEANAAWVQAQNEAGQRDMERIIKAMGASTRPAGR